MRRKRKSGADSMSPKTKKYELLLDLDGTLCESKELVPPFISSALRQLEKYTNLTIVTGAPHEQAEWQLYLLEGRCIIASENGAVIDGKTIFRHEMPDQLKNKALNILSELSLKYNEISFDNFNFEDKTASSNLSFVLRGPNLSNNEKIEKRKQFAASANNWQIRKEFVDLIKKEFPKYDAVIGGQVSVDIFPVGAGKERILKEKYLEGKKLFFVGDRTELYGNDHEIFKKLKGSAFKTLGVEHTQVILKNLLLFFKMDFNA
jgi:phosphomannomutase